MLRLFCPGPEACLFVTAMNYGEHNFFLWKVKVCGKKIRSQRSVVKAVVFYKEADSTCKCNTLKVE